MGFDFFKEGDFLGKNFLDEIGYGLGQEIGLGAGKSGWGVIY